LPMPFYKELDLTLPNSKQVAKTIDSFDPEILHISTPGPVGLIARSIALKRNIPLVGTYHTDFGAYLFANSGSEAIEKATHRYLSWFYRPFSKIFIRSSAYKEHLLQDIGFDKEILHLPPGIDLSRFTPKLKDRSIFKRYGIDAKYILLYVGRITKEKNFPFLVEVTEALPKSFHLVAVGEGALIERYKKRKKITFLGKKRGKELAMIYASSDLFLFPSTTDTLGQVVMEAMASGIGAIVSDKGGPRELVGKGGVVLRLDKALWTSKIEQIFSGGEHEKLGTRAYEIAQNFDIKRTFEFWWCKHSDVV